MLPKVNVLLFASLAILIASDFLPRLQVAYAGLPNRMVAAATLSVAVATIIALITPRVWVPPSMDKLLDPRAPELKPSPEETCSYLNYYLTYEWLTPMIWKGFRKPIEMADIPPLPWYDEPLGLLSKVLEAREKSKQSTLWMLLRYQRRELSTMAVWVCLAFSVEARCSVRALQSAVIPLRPGACSAAPWNLALPHVRGPHVEERFFPAIYFHVDALGGSYQVGNDSGAVPPGYDIHGARRGYPQ